MTEKNTTDFVTAETFPGYRIEDLLLAFDFPIPKGKSANTNPALENRRKGNVCFVICDWPHSATQVIMNSVR